MKLSDWWATRELVRAAGLVDPAIADLDTVDLAELHTITRKLRRCILSEEKRRQVR